MTETTTAPLLSAQGVGKLFGHVRALRDVSFDLHAGEVLAVLGDNGAGKSTLIKALSGVYDLTEGRLRVRGEDVSFGKPADATARGIATVYQDLALVDTRDVAANLFLGREFRRGPFVDRRRMYREAERILDGFTIKLPSVRVPIYLLSGGQRQAVAIARVLVGGADIVIMDEPTAALGVQESERVLRLVRDLRDAGKAVILISHNLQQVWQTADRIMVMHLGRVAGIRRRADSTVEEIVKLIVYGDPDTERDPDGAPDAGTGEAGAAPDRPDGGTAHDPVKDTDRRAAS
ncbi:monosaccharide ABC transporter ATP-binding protein, CUT2 family [Actinacidiphila yanglinensis]|uniref:Monosaccharide ABC transporter ATP-binding protein, CUT2 family n=1 Tax=Actinacidiphila yanglinensis TaxID=310779 RepID=A0A1H6DA21_9ACTN|nr:ATP-binding cassette domain-containing protein [Actinacidiphila yanglinensis]SEG81934.1 monosaccharide ABC transporter ATP-binding protein, CUT2 family [Actinacidiphila yanglinensis]